MIQATPSQVPQDATSLITFKGLPGRTVKWTLTGSGSLTPITSITDDAGSAAAVYTPGLLGETVTIGATTGA